MSKKVDVTQQFDFVLNRENEKKLYTWHPKQGMVTWAGSRGTDYKPGIVEKLVNDGDWIIVKPAELSVFPCAGVYAKLDCNAKVYIVGESSKQGTWVVETQSFSMLTMRTNQLKPLVDDDNRAYAIADDLKISFHQAMQMVKKGYGKL